MLMWQQPQQQRPDGGGAGAAFTDAVVMCPDLAIFAGQGPHVP
jgi:hypothetical protein